MSASSHSDARDRAGDRAGDLARGGALVLLRAGGLVTGLVVGFLVIGWVASLVLAPATSGLVNSIGFGIQVPPEVELAGLDQTSTVYAADGSVIAVLHDEVDRTVITLAEVPPHVQNAVVAAEDRRFWEHDGYDVEGLGRALLENVRDRGVSQGGSTITQQLAKSEVGDDISLQRKLTEIAFARALESQLTKEEILERYLNQVYFGGGAYGIAAAAEEYFAKPVAELNPAEAATLAGQIRSPGATDPRNFPDIAVRRRDATLRAMVEEGWLPAEELDQWLAFPLDIAPKVLEEPADPYIAEAVKQEFYTLEAFGADRLERNEALLNGGLEIHTSFDPGLQQLARDTVLSYFPEATPTAALASVDPRTGQIRAIFGGTDFDTEQFNFATQGRRQPGSSWKPFVMATALEIGFPVDLQLPGASPSRFETGDSWETEGVKNFGGASYGPMGMRQALVRSVNTAFAQLMLIVGPQNVVSLAQSLGINTNAALAGPTGPIVNPSIALGGLTVGVTPLEMAGAYSAFANAGAFLRPTLIDRVTDQQGNVLFERDTTPQQIFDPAVNEIMVDAMSDVVCCGTATRSSIRGETGWESAGKTGTSQTNADAWFVGYTPVLSTAVWVGHPEGRIAMSGVSSGRQPSQIWHDFMLAALQGQEPIPFPTEPPPGTTAQPPGEGEVTVPDVRDLPELEALQVLSDAGLPATTTSVDSTRPAGTVVWQSPRGGTVAPAGQVITVGISTGTTPPPPRPVATEQPSAAATPPPPEPTATATPAPVVRPDDPGQPPLQPEPAPPPPPPAPEPEPEPPPPAPAPPPPPPPPEEEPPPPPEPVERPTGG